jgi:hypothetical protein
MSLTSQCTKEKVWVYGYMAILFFLFPTFVFTAIDTDNDGLSDEQEAIYYTDAQNPDTDGDGYEDGIEIEKGYSPHKGGGARMGEYDYDNDGLSDWLEMWFGSDIGNKDTDGDGYTDFTEVSYGYSPVDHQPLQKYERRIEVDKSNQRLYYYVDKAKIFDFPVSTGNPQTETPTGEFIVQRMLDDKRYRGPGYDYSGVKWNMQFIPMYYIHGAYWHDDFGERTRSHGCVNMKTEDAEVLYKHVEVGMPVKVVGDTPKKYFVGT